MRRKLLVCLLAFGLLAGCIVFMGAEFYVVPVKGPSTSWDKKISGSTRFNPVLDGEAVLDRETGLVWEKSPSTSIRSWNSACTHCYQREVAGRKGWRLPTIEELASLVETSAPDSPKLPAGNPFIGVQSSYYWSSTTYAVSADYAWPVYFYNGNVGYLDKDSDHYVLCVRGGYGHDGY